MDKLSQVDVIYTDFRLSINWMITKYSSINWSSLALIKSTVECLRKLMVLFVENLFLRRAYPKNFRVCALQHLHQWYYGTLTYSLPIRWRLEVIYPRMVPYESFSFLMFPNVISFLSALKRKKIQFFSNADSMKKSFPYLISIETLL